eukprot:CAMPEP_0194770422 /NCGR_PEP_ID=MMETSP0323_2-20130528/46156_1 /TAXON_ID=2866 ORGANISM="Crypthecodinium cohnii, Strain Seligo" /NCGR_SAMPLE_ID=MMETSP0323_2 /ASSEMBLY_ACC=CAM_ASM_000346 /LENGTH=85 /DNA_ID=CAMNT_0039703973 /DNA_START=187 /DNA_END=441 /DNA_ORIENTATION=-
MKAHVASQPQEAVVARAAGSQLAGRSAASRYRQKLGTLADASSKFCIWLEAVSSRSAHRMHCREPQTMQRPSEPSLWHRGLRQAA